MIHIVVLFSFGVVLVATLVGYSQFAYAFWTTLSIGTLVLFRLILKTKRPILIAIIFIVLGISLYSFVQNRIQIQEQIYQKGFVYEDKVKDSFVGVVDIFPGYRYANNQYVVSITRPWDKPRMTPVETKILVYTQPFQKFAYLDSISFIASLQDVRQQDPQWHMYYQKLGVQYVAWYPNTTESQHTNPQTFKQTILYKLFILKSFIRNKSIERFSSHTSALVLGMLLGEKDELSKEEKDMFNRANLSHILVVSGYNISLVISFIFLILKSFPRYIKTGSAILFVFLFVLLVGGDASVVRSALMGGIVIIAKVFYRQASAVHTLFLVAMTMLLIKPNSIFDAGFHLSFLATYSLLILPTIKKIPEYILTTVWVFICICVYILYLSGSISFIGIITNIFVLFCIPFFMLLAFVSLGLSFFPIVFGLDVFILEIISRYIFTVAYFAQFVSRFEYQISPPVTVGIYLIALSIISFIQNRYTTSEFIEKHYQKFVPKKPS